MLKKLHQSNKSDVKNLTMQHNLLDKGNQ